VIEQALRKDLESAVSFAARYLSLLCAKLQQSKRSSDRRKPCISSTRQSLERSESYTRYCCDTEDKVQFRRLGKALAIRSYPGKIVPVLWELYSQCGFADLSLLFLTSSRSGFCDFHPVQSCTFSIMDRVRQRVVGIPATIKGVPAAIIEAVRVKETDEDLVVWFGTYRWSNEDLDPVRYAGIPTPYLPSFTDYRLTYSQFPVRIRATFGPWGGLIPVGIRCVLDMVWFGIQTYLCFVP